MSPLHNHTETDCACHSGESLQKMALEMALENPDKYYIPLEHYNRVTENLGHEMDDRRKTITDIKMWLHFYQIVSGILALILVLRWSLQKS